jgi:sulfite reductase (ferredoxin)
MRSFRTELENPVVEKDIIDLERRIQAVKNGDLDEEKFRSLRLARGIYGQRQPGVQMIRIKLPYGKLTSDQLLRIADVSDKYSTGRLHITTRQDIQIHYVSLDRTPELWAELEKDDITLREACGNTVRNITASETAGIDPNEPFDVRPHAHVIFQYFLRNPICQEMGRKFKISFSSTAEDTALSYMHDVGLIAKIHEGQKGYKVLIGGGLGSQSRHGDVIFDFLAEDKLIPIIEGIIRVFDRYGERDKRMKARLKFLINDLGLDKFLDLVEQERKALAFPVYSLESKAEQTAVYVSELSTPSVQIKHKEKYNTWRKSNVIAQKQNGLYAIGIKVQLGDFYTKEARALANLVKKYAGSELTLTLRQNILIRHVREDLLPFFYSELDKLGFVGLGYNSTADITACPGTDTCNLGITSSTGIAVELERILENEFPQYLKNKAVNIKISGCMNACGQHMMAHIGFQGMSVKVGNGLVAPALQLLLGGENFGNGKGRFADKVIKIPSKRAPEALRWILTDFERSVSEGTSFTAYYDLKGERYFYDLLKPLADLSALENAEFVDWGHDKPYAKAIGIGECAGVTIDLVSTLLLESDEKIENAKEAFRLELWSDSIFHAYAAIINSAKALLTSEGQKTNSYALIIQNFEEVFVLPGYVHIDATTFQELVYQIKENKPSETFATKYIQNAIDFQKQIEAYRTKIQEHAN